MVETKQSFQSRISGEIGVLTFDRISIDEAKILRLQGYRDPKKIRPTIQCAAATAARETEALIRPTVFHRCLDVRRCENGILDLRDDVIFENEAFDRFLNGVTRVVVFILTMGNPLDQAVKTYIANDQLLNALFLETAGWLGIEAATKKFSLYLKTLAQERDDRISPRLGPGYSYKLDGRSVIWPLEQQQILFSLFFDQTIDVELLESCVMLPKISRSGLFGFLPKPKA